MPALRVFLALGSASFLFAAASSTPRSPGCAAYEHVQKWKGTAVDDGNSCTSAKVVNGVTTYDSASRDGLPCNSGSNPGTCQSGECVPNCAANPTECTCSSADECPAATECLSWSCEAGKCNKVPLKTDLPIETQQAGDCQILVCKADGTEESLDYDMDKPLDAECSTGTCMAGKPVSNWSLKGTPCTMGICDGMGACKKADGDTCANASECVSGFCADGVCCNEACTGECMSCSVAGAEGACTNLPYYQDDLSYTDPVFMTPNVQCDSTSTCNGNGKCLKKVGKGCDMDADCISGACKAINMTKVCLGAPGEICSNNGQCASMACNNATGFCN